MKTWILKHRNPNGKLMFDMRSKLDIANFMIKITELGGEVIKLTSLINHTQTSSAIHYDDVNFLPYSPNNNLLKTEFFNLFLRFKAKPALQINYDLVNPIL